MSIGGDFKVELMKSENYILEVDAMLLYIRCALRIIPFEGQELPLGEHINRSEKQPISNSGCYVDFCMAKCIYDFVFVNPVNSGYDGAR